MNSKPKRGRPPNDPNAVRRGVFIRPRFPRPLHRAIKLAAFEDEVAMTYWVRLASEQELKRRKKIVA